MGENTVECGVVDVVSWSDAQATGEHYISPRNIDVGGGWGGVGDKTYSCFHG
jgi:hypothetical protein